MTQISVVLPYYNEEDYLPATLESLKAQDFGAFVLILVNNASTDRSEAICEAFEPGPTIAKVLLTEDEPGKTWALMRGIEEVKTPFVATCDADTYYPPEYLSRIVRMFQTDDNISAVLGAGTDSPLGRRKFRWVTRLMPRQCHSGGYAQAFRTAMLNAAGGFSVTRWPYVLEDHEIIHQVMKQGRIAHDPELCCRPSDRRADRSAVTWTLMERLLYHVTPADSKPWFFSRFLAPRFERRGLFAVKLRDKTWAEDSHPQ